MYTPSLQSRCACDQRAKFKTLHVHFNVSTEMETNKQRRRKLFAKIFFIKFLYSLADCGVFFLVPLGNLSTIWRRQHCRLFVDARGFDTRFVFVFFVFFVLFIVSNSFFPTNKKTNLFVFANKSFSGFLYQKTFFTTELLLPLLDVLFCHFFKKFISFF